LEETPWHNRWSLGPCTSDGTVERLPKKAVMNVTAGLYSSNGPRCQLKQMDGQRSGRCFDAESGKSQPGGRTQVFPCTDKWYQFVSFGDGVLAPVGSIYTKIPSHIVKQIINLGHEQSQFLCLGVAGRGANDEGDWEATFDDSQTPVVATNRQQANESGELDPLSEWLEHELITTQCTNTGAVIEWLFVPYIVEEGTQDVVSTGDDITADGENSSDAYVDDNNDNDDTNPTFVDTDEL
jgi:hypothetical protein